MAPASFADLIVAHDMASVHRLAEIWPDLVALTDVDGGLLYLNQAGAELVGANARAPRRLADILDEDGARQFAADGAATALGDGRWHARTGLRHLRTLGRIEASITAFPVTNPGYPGPVLVVVCRDLRPLADAERVVRQAAERDPLTDVLSRAQFIERLDRALADHPATGGGLMALDVDNFGMVNAAFGHSFGDELLRRLADEIAAAVAPGTLVGRLSGDEFCLLVPGADAHALRLLGDRLLAAVRSLSRRLTVSASAGFVLFGPFSARDGERLLTAADVALGQAKAAGGDRLASFSETATADLDWVRQVRRAIDESRLVLYAQPLVELAGGDTVGHELLLRMIADDGEIAPPASFLTTAERFGLVGALDRWVMERALDLYRDGHRVAVNLSARSLLDHPFAHWIASQCSDGANDSGHLTIEITETATVDGREAGRHFIDLASGPHCGFALDDFGTGYATLAVLRDFPCGQVKLDRSFVAELADSPRDQVLVGSVVDCAHKLGFTVVAEGIEDEGALAAVRACGADVGQGYLLGEPAPVGELIG